MPFLFSFNPEFTLLVSGIYPQRHDVLLGSAIEYRSEVTELKKRPNITQKAL
ncbi:hypothetical protein [Wolbachia endosymbiont (group A) of Colletes cunicularius]|uniref:hypothetical protein n=1 Tax=Wolbachia endosymbiont (group A) of Colletes cunicularius TaxID=3139321 RepID=UPI0035C8BD9A